MSFGSPSLNDLIDKSLVCIPFDSLRIFSPHVIYTPIKSHHIKLCKSDIQGAYQILPMTPQWQIFQMICVQNFFHVNHCTNFGSSGSAKSWRFFFPLALWIASNIFEINKQIAYLENLCAAAPQNLLIPFPYHQITLDQAKLLNLFSLLGAARSWGEQIWVPTMDFISHQF